MNIILKAGKLKILIYQKTAVGKISSLKKAGHQ